MVKNNFWSPYVAGAGLGLVLLATFYVMGMGLGASSTFSISAAVVTQEINPGYASSLKYFSRYLSAAYPLKDWIVLEVAGLFLGALTGAVASRNFSIKLDGPAHMRSWTRTLAAFTGGAIIGFSGRLARGCTSGVALSGGAQLAISGWIFVLSMFIAGFIVAAIMRRLWS